MDTRAHRFATVAFILLMAGCATKDNVLSTEDATALSTFSSAYSWTLPKTVLDVSAVWTFEGCNLAPGRKDYYLPDFSVKVTVAAKGMADRDLGPRAPTGWISLDAADGMQSFWQDSQITVKTFNSSHLLQALGSTSTNQVGTIIGNVVTTVVKAAGIVLGSPATASSLWAEKTGCDMTAGGANALYKKLQDTQKKLKDVDADSAAGKKLVSSITTMKNQLNLTVSATIDPGKDVNGKPAPIPAGEALRIITPSSKQLNDMHLLDKETLDDILSKNETNPLSLSVYLDFNRANPPSVAKCANSAQDCDRKTTPLSAGAMFREVAYIPVVVYKGIDKGATGAKLVYDNVFPFAQFGVSRSLPLKAPIFGKASWSFTFNELGEISEATWISTAKGVAMTGAASSIAGGASSIDALNIKSDQQLDSATQAQQLLNSKLKVWTDGVTLQAACQAALAKGQVPSCD